MDAVIPWERLLALIEPHYPRAGNGTQPLSMERILRIYFMQKMLCVPGCARREANAVDVGVSRRCISWL